jgi:hypothetical protein
MGEKTTKSSKIKKEKTNKHCTRYLFFVPLIVIQLGGRPSFVQDKEEGGAKVNKKSQLYKVHLINYINLSLFFFQKKVKWFGSNGSLSDSEKR